MRKNIQILSTKKLNDTLITNAENIGITIVSTEFIEIKSIDSSTITEKIKHYSAETIAVIFTSVNAVEAVFAMLDTKPDWKIFCTSGATKEALLKYIDEKRIVDTEHNASALADKVIAHKGIDSCVFFCGNQRLNTLPDKLLRHKIDLDEVIVYESIASSKKINENYDGILFFSPSGVDSFFSVNKIDNKTVLFSIGKTTTKEIRKCTNNHIVTSFFPSAESVVAEVKKYFIESVDA